MIVGQAAEAQLDDLAEKYLGERPYPWRRQGEERVKIIVEPVRVYGQ